MNLPKYFSNEKLFKRKNILILELLEKKQMTLEEISEHFSYDVKPFINELFKMGLLVEVFDESDVCKYFNSTVVKDLIKNYKSTMRKQGKLDGWL